MGVGTASPQALFHAAATNTTVWPFTSAQSGTYSYTPYPHELVVDNDTTGNEGSFASVFFSAGADSDGSKIATARIGAVETGHYKADLVFGTRNTSFQERMRILADGKVGIGTSSPAYALDVDSTIHIGNDGGSSYSHSRLIFDSNGSVRAAGNFFHNQANDVEWFAGNVYNLADSFSVTRNATASHADATADVTNSLFTIRNDGKVGIGTTSPAAQLNVDVGAPSSSDQILGLFQSQTARQIGFVWDDSASTLGVATITAHDLVFHTSGNSSEKMRITTGGNVGIGNTNPSGMHANANKLVVGTGSGDQGMSVFAGTSVGRYAFARAVGNNTDAYDGGMSYDGSRNLKFHTNAGATRMTIDGSGKVGIGTTSPSASTTLDVNGVLGVGNARVHETRVNQTLALTTAAQRGGMSINSWYNSAAGPIIDFNISRNNTAGSHTVVQTNDALGTLIFRGDDGDEFIDSAAIETNVDAAPGNGDMPGRLVFYTSPDGTTGLQERMRIDNQGRVTKPSNPSFLARADSNTGLNASSGYLVRYGAHSVLHNIGSYYNSSTYIFTAPVTGSYLFNASLRVDGFSGNYGYLTLRHYSAAGAQQSDKGRDLQDGNNSTYMQHDISSIVYLSVGDYVYVTYQNDGDSSVNLNDDSWFSGYLLG